MAENTKSSEQLELEKLKAKVAELEKVNADQDQIIQDQLEVLENAKAASGKALPVVTHKKVQYQLVAPKANIAGKIYTAEEIASNKELVAALVENRSGLLVELSK